jgi:phage tail sheath protein FI
MEDLEAYSAKHKKPIEDIMEYLGARRWANQTLSGADRTSPGKERMMKRARTFQGIADAMAEQWTQFIASGGQTNPRRQLHLFSDVAEEVDPFCSAYAALRRKYDARTAFKLHEMYCGCRFVPQKEQAL